VPSPPETDDEEDDPPNEVLDRVLNALATYLPSP
jgi:hypothetical protein